jgi:hypothetical protein
MSALAHACLPWRCGGRSHPRQRFRGSPNPRGSHLTADPPPGRVAVEVDQLVRGPDGAVLAEGRVVHDYTFRDGQIARMDVEESARD